MSTARALVTGAAGFVGASLVRRLLADGVDVVAGVRPGGDAWRLAGISPLQLVTFDLEDPDAVSAVLQRARPDTVFHLAAHGSYSWQTDRRRIAATNFVAFVDLLEACEASGVEVVVNAGSSSEYGLKRHAAAETDPLAPNSDYAVAKAAASLYGRHAALSRALRVVTLRLYSVYGPWEDPRRLVPTLLARALRGSLPPLVDPAVARDFVYVDDAVSAFLAALSATEPGAIYNVASGSQTTLAAIVETVRDLFGVTEEPQWGTMANRSWDSDAWVGDPSLIAAQLGWHSSTGLAEGLQRTAAWLQSRPDQWQRYGVSPSSEP